MCVRVCMCTVCMWIIEKKLLEVHPILPLCESWGVNSGHQARLQVLFLMRRLTSPITLLLSLCSEAIITRPLLEFMFKFLGKLSFGLPQNLHK